MTTLKLVALSLKYFFHQHRIWMLLACFKMCEESKGQNRLLTSFLNLFHFLSYVEDLVLKFLFKGGRVLKTQVTLVEVI